MEDADRAFQLLDDDELPDLVPIEDDTPSRRTPEHGHDEPSVDGNVSKPKHGFRTPIY